MDSKDRGKQEEQSVSAGCLVMKVPKASHETIVLISCWSEFRQEAAGRCPEGGVVFVLDGCMTKLYRKFKS